MYDFEKATIWKDAFGERADDPLASARAELKNSFFNFRERASQLVDQIPKDMAGLTLHNTSHLDSLWETASLIAGSEIVLNPAEAFVLGGSILLHDAGMSTAAFPNGLDDIKKTISWRDTAHNLLTANELEPTEELVQNPPKEIEGTCIFLVLRELHAQTAEILATQAWEGLGSSEYLVQDSDLRDFYGPTIGSVAHSHWWSTTELPNKLPGRLGAGPGVPADWTVDVLKIACLLRCADACHIDSRRAPRFLYSITKPDEHSSPHWSFQSKLSKPFLEGNNLVFTSGSAFDVQDAKAWWLCHDTIQMINEELAQTDILLERLEKIRFAARRVKGAESPRTLSLHIRTTNWEPVDAQLKVTDVEKIVALLGGEKLYGEDPRIPIRELIQNARDAVHARRVIQNLGDKWGEIRVRVSNTDDAYWLEIHDSGIGMSPTVITDALLDFGTSFWGTSLSRREFPGLESEGFSSVGKFGIGFYSVFMIGDLVRVVSRRFDSALAEAKTLEFGSGVERRPLLRDPAEGEVHPDFTTSVYIRLKTDPRNEGGIFHFEELRGKVITRTLDKTIGMIAPVLDVKITTVEEAEDNQLRNNTINCDWDTCTDTSLVERLTGYDEIEIPGELFEIRDASNNIIARATLDPDRWIFDEAMGAVTVGGLTSQRVDNICGVFLGQTELASRNRAVPIATLSQIRSWAEAQAQFHSSRPSSSLNSQTLAHLCSGLGAEIFDLPFIQLGEEPINKSELVEILDQNSEIKCLLETSVTYEEYEDDVLPREFENEFEIYEDVFLISNTIHRPFARIGFPKNKEEADEEEMLPMSCWDIVKDLITQTWGPDIEETPIEVGVGSVGTTEIVREVIIVERAED